MFLKSLLWLFKGLLYLTKKLTGPFTYFLDEVASLAADAEKKSPEERTEREKIAIMGKPRLGDITRAQIRIKESKEFKVSVSNGCLTILNALCHALMGETVKKSLISDWSIGF